MQESSANRESETEGTWLRLSGREWLVVGALVAAFMGLAPAVWERLEPLESDPAYRLPYEQGSDYWLWSRHCRRSCAARRMLVVGDSVVWGHYVNHDETLSASLGQAIGDASFANLGVDGIHPMAMEGLLRHYGRAIKNRKVILHFNPLWMTSPKADLQIEKETSFNHPSLVPQFVGKPPCYRASLSKRLSVLLRRQSSVSAWSSHLVIAELANRDLASWTLEYPYRCPWRALLPDAEAAPYRRPPVSSRTASTRPDQDLPWVDFDKSLQWKAFQRTVRLLQRRGNELFVLLGPFNEHALSDNARRKHDRIATQASAWLDGQGVRHLVCPLLEAPLYVDASHPTADGYATIAAGLSADASFRRFLAE